MKELIFDGNIFAIAKDDPRKVAVAITTNGICKKNGQAVMGRGIAKYGNDNLRITDPSWLKATVHHNITTDWTLPDVLGNLLRSKGNHAYYLGTWLDTKVGAETDIITMPTKNNWKNPSDIKLIEQSCREMVAIAEANALDCVYLPAPGCSNGQLAWKDVKEAISAILPDTFVCVHPPM